MTGPLSTVEIARSDGLSAAIVGSTCRGVTYVTVVFKATFELVDGARARPVSPESVVGRDARHTRDVRSSLAHASEVAPYLSHAAILVSGFAYPRASAANATFPVRLAILGEKGSLVDKYLVVASDKGAAVPLTYERALATAENPSGSNRPQITSPQRPAEAAGFGPIPPSSPSRAQYLRGAPHPEADPQRGHVVDLGQGVDPRYFNPAPVDQQTRLLEGNETIVLEGLDRELPRLVAPLGGVSVVGHVARGAERSQLNLALDMLVIDAERRRASAVWRSMLTLASPRQKLCVEAGLKIVQRGASTSTGEMLAVPPASALPFARAERAPASKSPRSRRRAVDASAKKKLEQTLDPFSRRSPVLPFPQTEPHTRAPDEKLLPATPYDDQFAPDSVVPAAGFKHTLVTPPQDPLPEVLPAEPPVPPAFPPPASPPLPPVESEDPRRRLVVARLRDKASLREMDLAGADLSNLDLDGCSFSGAKLGGANLSKSRLRRANLASVDLGEAKLTGANLEDVDLSNANLRGADLSGASLTKANLRGANLTNARFTNGDLTGADLERAGLTAAILDGVRAENANFEGASVVGAKFSNAKLARARFVKASMDEASFEGADMTEADLTQCAAPDAQLSGATLDRAVLKQAKLPGARLSKAKLHGANLQRVDLSLALLDEADLRNADARSAKLTGANLTRAVLDHADMRDANLGGAELAGATRVETKLKGARLPAG